MSVEYDKFKEKAFSAMRGLAKECPVFEDAEMLVGSSEATASLHEQKIYKSIDTEWVDVIERTLPALDLIIRNPNIAIEDVDEILPVEISRHITEKSIKHLAQHTNLILDIKKNGDVVPQKILNVYHDETLLIYENKFVNTLLARLSAFVDKRYRALMSSSGMEKNYKFDYATEFEHHLPDDSGRNLARIHLNIELTSPLNEESESNWEIRERYVQALERIKRINMAIIGYQSSPFVRALGRNYIRPPVIRTNLILKNKNFRECLTLWEYIETFDKVGYTVRMDGAVEKPSHEYIRDLYSSVALQYSNFYYGIADGKDDVRLLSQKHLFEMEPLFDTEFPEEELEDYQVYDSEYKKTVPVSRLMNNRKKLSDDEKRIHRAILVALKADEILNAKLREEEKERLRLARQRRLEEEEKRRAEEEARAKLEAYLAKTPVPFRYRRSFLSRYIQSGEVLQGYYGRLKNQLLSYEGVKSRISWKADTFSKGRARLAKMDVRGKRLYLYLALDPKDFADSKYRIVDVRDKTPETPTLLKIRGSLGLKHAAELIDILALRFALRQGAVPAIDYSMPYEDNDALVEKGLIKLVFPKGITLDDGSILTKEDLSAFFKNRPKKLPPVEETSIADEAEQEVAIAATEKEPFTVRYRRSFLSRYIQSGEDVQKIYAALKNELLSYEGVKSRISWKADTFSKGRTRLAKMDVRGKRVYLSLALEPKDFLDSKYRFADVRDKTPETPMLLKIRGSLGLKHAVELIEIVAMRFALRQTEAPSNDYSMPYEDNDALIAKGLIKVVLPKGVSAEDLQDAKKEDLNVFFANLRHRESATEEVAEELAPSEPEPVENEEEEETLVAVRYRRSFLSRFIQSEVELQLKYTQIKNFLLSHESVRSRISWKLDSFSSGRTQLARLDVRGKRLCLYLALDPAEFADSKYFFVDVSKKYPETPMQLKIKGSQGMRYAQELITLLMEKHSLLLVAHAMDDFRMPYEDDQALIEKGLIKVVLPSGVTISDGVELEKTNIRAYFKNKESEQDEQN